MNRRTRIVAATIGIDWLFASQARSVSIDSELERFQGRWRVTGMVEDGHVMSAAEMLHGLPGGAF